MKRLAGMLLVVIRAGRGRALPLLLLALAAGLFARIEESPLLTVREAQFDHYQRWQPRSRDNEPVIIVGIDSQSLVEHGQWPWPRDLIARLVESGEGELDSSAIARLIGAPVVLVVNR